VPAGGLTRTEENRMSAVPAKQESTAVVVADGSALMKIIERGVSDPNFDPAKLAQLLEVKERWDRNEAQKAYTQAMARFKADPPTILKSKGVNIPGGASFSHATLAHVCDAIVASLSSFGFSHRWEVNQADKQIIVTCIITHELGHSERTTLGAAPDDSGKKNAIQQVASTVTYLERYTLLAATGLAAKDMDDDGRGAGGGSAGKMEEGKLADFLAAIDASATEADMKKAFGNAWNATEAVKDKHAQAKLIEHRDARRKKGFRS
jgi:hypothetical protein